MEVNTTHNIKVCDAIMGTGKSSAAINYMNQNPTQKFIYITPYLDEATRIKQNCPLLNFIEPSNKLSEYEYKKYLHTMALIKQGKNITTTHQSFKRYTQETLDSIKQQGYILIIDESVDVLEVFDFHEGDLKLAVDAGYIREECDEYVLANNEYKGTALAEMFGLLRSRRLIRINDKDGAKMFYWTLPPELMTSFKEVFILTYLFEGQSLYYFLKIHNLEYQSIGIKYTENGYEFCDSPESMYTPDYVNKIKGMIEVLDNERMNEVGNEYFALSLSWYKRGGEGVKQVRKNVYNYFNNIHKDVPAEKKLWGTFNHAKGKIQGKGYTRAFLSFNARATNAYRERNCLAYPVNLFMNVSEKKFYTRNNLNVDEDAYALSIMIQWIWRSEIREGEKIRLYIPSRRMRELLTDWMENLEKTGGVKS